MRIGIIGCGMMGSALAEGLSKQHSLFLYDKDGSRTEQLSCKVNGNICRTTQHLINNAEIILLAIKPHYLNEAASEITPHLQSSQLVISVLTGTTMAVLEQAFPSITCVRIMPSLAVQTGKGVIGIVDSPKFTEQVKNILNEVFHPLAYLYWLKEDQINALTALTGSGPAFILTLIEAMVEAGVSMGFQASVAQELIMHMIKGTIALLEETNQHPAALKWQIASPGGTTIAGIRVMEREKVKSGLMETFLATFEKAKEMTSKLEKTS